MKPTQEQVVQWAREAGVHEQWFKGDDCPPIVFRLATLAYEAGRKDENEMCAEIVGVGTGEPVQMKTLEILRQERERIANAIRARREQ